MMQPPIRHRAGPLYFLFASALYLLGVTYLGASGLVYLSMVSVTVALLVGLSRSTGGRTENMSPFFFAMAAFAVFNLYVTTERQETALRWLVWFEMFFAFGLLASECDEEVDKSLAALLPFGTLLIWFAKYQAANESTATLDEREADLHLSAFFAGITLASGLLYPRFLWRLVFCAAGIYGVLVSGSRAAFLFLPLLFVVPCLYYFRSRTLAFVVALLPAALLAALFFNESFRAATFGRKAEDIGKDAIVDAQDSFDDRGFLRKLAVEMIRDRPWGYGYGNTYVIPGTANKSRGTNFHNGYLNVGAEMGAPFLALYACFNAWLVWALYFDRHTSKLFRHLFLSILVCANLRALVEDFTLFDLGNPICYLVVYLTFMFLNKRRYMPSARNA